jgi:hypothetical protein
MPFSRVGPSCPFHTIPLGYQIWYCLEQVMSYRCSSCSGLREEHIIGPSMSVGHVSPHGGKVNPCRVLLSGGSHPIQCPLPKVLPQWVSFMSGLCPVACLILGLCPQGFLPMASPFQGLAFPRLVCPGLLPLLVGSLRPLEDGAYSPGA